MHKLEQNNRIGFVIRHQGLLCEQSCNGIALPCEAIIQGWVSSFTA
jgi:hypothetical protein